MSIRTCLFFVFTSFASSIASLSTIHAHVAVLTPSLRVHQSVFMSAKPCEMLATEFVVAVAAHALGVVLALVVGAFRYAISCDLLEELGNCIECVCI